MSRSSGQVTHVLLTRSRLCPRPKPGSSLHLHVLGTPPAFVLSQDQTLRERVSSQSASRPKPRRGSSVMKSVTLVTNPFVHMRGWVVTELICIRHLERPEPAPKRRSSQPPRKRLSNLDAIRGKTQSREARASFFGAHMLFSFQRPCAPRGAPCRPGGQTKGLPDERPTTAPPWWAVVGSRLLGPRAYAPSSAYRGNQRV